MDSVLCRVRILKRKKGEGNLKLLNCHIVNFGCLSNRSYTFEDGLNVLYAENGSGKSTLAVFLKVMLYGFASTNKNNLTENERKRYTPWNGGKFGGSLSFAAKGKEYRIERFFGLREKDDTFKLFNLATQKEVTDYDARLGTALLGVDADGFERSLYVSQRAPFLPPKNNTIRAKLGTLLDASDDLGAFEEASRRLDVARRSYITTGNRGKVGDLEREIKEKENALAGASAAGERAAALLNEAKALSEEKTRVLTAIETARSNRTLAEKRRLLEETAASHRRLADAVSAEKRTIAPLEAFFGEHLPTDAHLAEAEQALGRLEGHEAQHSLCGISKENAESLSLLQKAYGDTDPESELSRIRGAFAAYEQAKKTAEDTIPSQNLEFDALCLHFFEKEPNEQDIEALHKATADYDNAEANLMVEEELLSRRRKPSPLTLLFAALSLIFLALGITCFFLSRFLFGSIGCVLSLVFFAAILIHRAPKTKRSARGELQKAHAVLSALLLPYRYKEKNPSLCAKLLFKDIVRFRALREEKERRAAEHDAALKDMESLASALDTAFARYEKQAPPYAEALKALEKELSLYARLKDEERAGKEQKAALSLQIKNEKSLLDKFLSPSEELLSIPYREALSLLRERSLLLSTAKDRLLRAEEELAAFLKESAFDPTLPLPPYIGESESFAGEEKLLSERLLQLETQISVKETEAQYQSESAASIPSLSAGIEALKAEKGRSTAHLRAARHGANASDGCQGIALLTLPFGNRGPLRQIPFSSRPQKRGLPL